MVSLRAGAKMYKRGGMLVENLEHRLLLASDWQNPISPLNVDGVDGDHATPIDALQIINELTVPTVRDHVTFRLPDLGPEEGAPPPFYDVDGDQVVSPLDALMVINALAENTGNVSGGTANGEVDYVVAGSRAAADHGVGHDTLVNTTTSRVQAFPDVAGFTDGSFVSVWHSVRQDGSSTGVYGQMYDSVGSKVGDEFLVNSTTRKSQEKPAVATGPDGHYAVVWQSLAQDGSAWGVYGQMFNDQGPVGGEFLVNQTTRGNQYLPDATFLSDGSLAVTWEGRGPSDRHGVFVRQFDSSGNAVSDEMPVNLFERGAQNRPAITSTSDGGFIVAWDGRGDGINQGIFMRQFGSNSSGDIAIGNTDDNRQTRASIASGPDGQTIIAWQERPEENGGWGTRAVHFDSNTDGMLGSVIHANQTTRGLQAGTSVAILDDGTMTVAWFGRGEGDRLGVFTRMFDASGNPMTDETLANETTRARQSRPAVAALGAGYVTVWDGFGDSDPYGIYSRFESGVSGGNTEPMLVQPIPDQTAISGSLYSFDITSFFADADPADVLTYTAVNGQALPAWLSFNSTTGTFMGTPGTSDIGSVDITVTATDLAGTSVSDLFSLAVVDAAAQFTIAGSVFGDTDGDGVLGAGEMGTAGVSVALQDAMGNSLLSTSTATDGTYSFTTTGGNYTVVVTPPAGVQTGDPDGTLDNRTTLALAADVTALDFGYNQAPTASSIGNQTVQVGSPLSLGVAGVFMDAEGGDLTLSSSALPSWLNFDAGTAMFAGTPSAGDVGTVDITVTATDLGGLSAMSAFQILVQDNAQNQQPIVTGTIPAETVASGSALSKDISGFFSDPDGDTLTYSATTGGSSLPSWIDFNETTGVFTGTPADTDAGTITVSVTASDSMLDVSTDFNLTVTTNQSPIVDSAIMDQIVEVGSPLSLNVTDNFSDPDGDMLTLSAVVQGGGALPSWLDFDAGTGLFSGTPAAGDVATNNVVVTASDGQASVSDTFVIDVQEMVANRAPVVQTPIDDQLATIDRQFNLDVTSAFSDPDGDTLTFTVGSTLPGWLSFADGVFMGTPSANDLSQMTEITVTATDPDTLSAMDTFTVTVVGNQAPGLVVPIPDMDVVASVPYSFTVANFFNDPDGDTLTYMATGLPSWLSFDTVTGEFMGTPSASDTGSFDVTVTASDPDMASANDTFTVTVVANMAPSASDIMDQEALVDLNLFLRTGDAFSDPDPGDQFTFTAMLEGGGDLPDWLTINSTSGLLTGTPADGDIGQISVVVTATDLAGQSASTSPFQVNVTNQGTAVIVSLMTLDMDGNVITTVAAGQDFQLVASVQDARTAPTGVFSAYMDVNYTVGLVTPTGSIQHSATYPAGASGDTTTAGLIDEVGGTDGTSQLGGDVFEVFRLQMTAGLAPGTVTFSTDMADDLTQHPLLVFSETGATPPQYVDFGGTTLNIVASTILAGQGLDSIQRVDQPFVPVRATSELETAKVASREVLADVALSRWAADRTGYLPERSGDHEPEFAVQLFVDELFE